MGAWVRGCVGAWVRACVGAWVRACVSAWVRGCVGAWVRGCVRAWVRGCARAWVRGCVGGCVRGWACVVQPCNQAQYPNCDCNGERTQGGKATMESCQPGVFLSRFESWHRRNSSKSFEAWTLEYVRAEDLIGLNVRIEDLIGLYASAIAAFDGVSSFYFSLVAVPLLLRWGSEYTRDSPMINPRGFNKCVCVVHGHASSNGKLSEECGRYVRAKLAFVRGMPWDQGKQIFDLGVRAWDES